MKTKRITLIFGSGAIRNGWVPVQRALERVLKIKDISHESAYLYFAKIIYLLRFFNSNRNIKEFNRYKKLLNGIKKAIREEIQSAVKNKEVECRRNLIEIIEKLILVPSEDAFEVQLDVMTTNWDMCGEELLRREFGNDINTIGVTYIHGNILNDNFYLPGEVIGEPYRTSDEIMELQNIHKYALSTLKKTDKIILYGISISPLEAELSQYLSTGLWKTDLNEICIVDVNPLLIRDRINMLLESNSNVTISHYHPDELILK